MISGFSTPPLLSAAVTACPDPSGRGKSLLVCDEQSRIMVKKWSLETTSHEPLVSNEGEVRSGSFRAIGSAVFVRPSVNRRINPVKNRIRKKECLSHGSFLDIE